MTGHEPPFPDAYPEIADGLPDDQPSPHGGADASAPVKRLLLSSVASWRGKPMVDRKWLVTDRIPADDAVILSGDGGGGKTTIITQLAVASAGDLGDWLGAVCQRGTVLFFSAEEGADEMRRRVAAACRARGLDPDELERLHFHFAEPENCLLGVGRPNGPIAATSLFASLRETVEELKPALVIIGSIAATFGGNQNDRVHARSFCGLFRQMARDCGCGVVLLDHPSLTGITNGSGRGGSMDWQNATRGRMHLAKLGDDADGAERMLTVMKGNYSKDDDKGIKLKWRDGCFVMLGTVSDPAKAAAERAADQAYLACLDKATQDGINVYHGTGKGHAPGVFADMAQAKTAGVNKRALIAAQQRLFDAQIIWNQPFGPQSKNTRRVARKPDCAMQEAAE